MARAGPGAVAPPTSPPEKEAPNSLDRQLLDMYRAQFGASTSTLDSREPAAVVRSGPSARPPLDPRRTRPAPRARPSCPEVLECSLWHAHPLTPAAVAIATAAAPAA